MHLSAQTWNQIVLLVSVASTGRVTMTMHRPVPWSEDCLRVS